MVKHRAIPGLAAGAALAILAAMLIVMGVAGAPASGATDPARAPGPPGSAAQRDGSDSRLVVPGLAKERPASLTEHVLDGDESLFHVATLYQVTLELLLELNGLDEPEDVGAGDTVVVTDPGPPPAQLPCGDLLAPVDKQHRLPANCGPEDLATVASRDSYGEAQHMQPQAAGALGAMFDAAEAAGHRLYVRSSYRSYAEQADTFQFWVDQLGFEEASRVSAEAGHSEHQLGTVADVTNEAAGFQLTQDFADTPGGQWLAENAQDFGFVVSYPAGREAETGYSFEPWHIRFVGEDTAQDYEASGLTLNQYLAREWLPGRYLVEEPLD